MSLSRQLGNFCLKAAKAIFPDVSPQTQLVSISKKRADPSLFVAHSAQVSSSAKLGKNSSVWFNAQVGNDVVVGAGSSILDGAVVEDGCVLGEGCVVKQGAVLRKGTVLGNRVLVGLGSQLPEKFQVKDFSILPDGFNNDSVKQMTESKTESEEEALFLMLWAAHFHKGWSRTPEEREAALQWLKDQVYDPDAIRAANPSWSAYVPYDPHKFPNPERPGLIYDKN